MVHIRAAHAKDNSDITPILWQDNYFSLLPGEQREVTATYTTTALSGSSTTGAAADTPVLEISGFNISKQTIEATTSSGGYN